MRDGGSRWPFGERHEDERLSALLDDELDDDEALAVTRHVARCQRCERELTAIRLARLALRALPAVEPPVELCRALLRPAPRAPRRWRRWAAASVAGGLLVGAAAFLAGHDGGTIAPPVHVFVVDHAVRSDGGPVLRPVDVGR
ncbi:MAG: zf-HC2 domain-containing protein [Actinomycetota bacterium]|nr:zf-HC2 domain-containing protein [Actinomycetota bacterium]